MAEKWSKVEVWKPENPASESIDALSLVPWSNDRERQDWQEGSASNTKVNGYSPQPFPDPSGSVPLSFYSQTQQDESSLLISSGRWKPITTMGNVYAIRYVASRETLIVQYKHWAPPMPHNASSGAGPIYAYGNISVGEARAAFNSPDINRWLDANVKLNPESSSQHRKPYRLLAGSFGYTPRKAVWRPDMSQKEWYVERVSGGSETKNHSSETRPAR